MRQIKWLLTLADGKPLLFSLAILLIAVCTLGLVVKNRDSKIDNCNEEKNKILVRYEYKLDSVSMYYRQMELALNKKIEENLNNIIQGYKEQLEEQKNLSNKVNRTILKNKELITSSPKN